MLPAKSRPVDTANTEVHRKLAQLNTEGTCGGLGSRCGFVDLDQRAKHGQRGIVGKFVYQPVMIVNGADNDPEKSWSTSATSCGGGCTPTAYSPPGR